MRQITIPKELKIADDYAALLTVIEDLITENLIAKIYIFAGTYASFILGNELAKDLDNSSHIKSCKINYQIVNDQDLLHESDLSQKLDNNWLLAIGGGKVLDQVKYLAAKTNSKFISVPTLISHDGICSPVAVLNGKSYGAVMPYALLVPLFIIKDASTAQIQSGVGDLIANLSAIEDWKLANKYKGEEIDSFAAMLSKQSAMSVISILETQLKLKNNKQNWSKDFIHEEFFLRSLIEALAISGIAMSICGNSRPCSGAEHMISHAIDEIYGHGVKASHGIQVLIATLFLESLRGYDLIKSIFSQAHDFDLSLDKVDFEKLEYNSILFKLLAELDFPTKFADIGIDSTELKRIIQLAPQTRKNRFTILDLFLNTEAKA